MTPSPPRGANDPGPLTGPRTLPVGIRPLPGESLESCLAALARQLDMRWGPFLKLVLPPASLSAVHQVSHLSLTAALTTEELIAISEATGIDSTAIEELTWHRYDGTAGTIDVTRRRMQMVWRFARSRFCPLCLKLSGGRWQLQWRLPWVFSCLDHSCLLADTCPACGRMQGRSNGGLSGGHIPRLALCGSISQASQGCATDLSTARAVTLDDGHPFLTTQAALAEILSRKEQSFGLYQFSPTSTAQFLQDLRLLAQRFARAADRQRAPAFSYARSSRELTTEWESAGVRQWRSARESQRNSPALITAVGITSALKLLQCHNLDEAARHLQPILASRHNVGKQANADALTTKGQNPIPDAVTVRTLTPTMGPADRLRYRTLTPLPRWPRTLPAKELRSIPTYLWTDWAIRLLPIGGKRISRHKNTRAALAILLATVGNRADEAEIARGLALGDFGRQWAQRLSTRVAGDLYRHPLWPNIVDALTRLSDYLADQQCPIDYARRRELIYRELLSDNEWQSIFDATDFGRLGCESTGQRIRTWLFQRISMLPAELAPFTRESADRHREPIEMLGPPMVRELDDIALQFLKHHSIIDEPVTWSPPLSLVADLQLPGVDVDLLSIAKHHAELLKGPQSLPKVAQAAGVSTLVVCHLLERSPLPRPVCRGQQPRQMRLDRARLLLSPREFARLYTDEKWSMLAIARHFGFDSRVGKQLALEYGIELIPPPNQPRSLPAAWLREEYVGNQRSLADIAREAGVSRNTVRKFLRGNGIELRAAASVIDAEWIYQEHVIRGRLIQDLAREKHVSRGRLSRRAKACGITVRRNPRSNLKIDITEEWLHREHVIKGRPLADMAREANVAYQTLSIWMKKLGIPVRRNPRSGATMVITEDWLREQYLIKHRTLVDLSQEAGVNYRTLSNKAKRWRIPIHHGGRPTADDTRSPKA